MSIEIVLNEVQFCVVALFFHLFRWFDLLSCARTPHKVARDYGTSERYVIRSCSVACRVCVCSVFDVDFCTQHTINTHTSSTKTNPSLSTVWTEQLSAWRVCFSHHRQFNFHQSEWRKKRKSTVTCCSLKHSIPLYVISDPVMFFLCSCFSYAFISVFETQVWQVIALFMVAIWAAEQINMSLNIFLLFP